MATTLATMTAMASAKGANDGSNNGWDRKRPAWKRLVPKPVRQRIRSLSAWPETFGLTSDIASFRNFRRLENSATHWEEPQQPVAVRLRALGGRPVLLRPETTDTFVLRTVFFGKYHLPPPKLVNGDARLLFDLGAYTGLTTSQLAAQFPSARVIAVELQAQNAELCRLNVAPWGERCEVVEGAVWPSDTRVAEGAMVPGHPDSFKALPADQGSGDKTIDGVSLNTLVETYASEGPVDYMKMDIEGAEREILRKNTDWAPRVRCIKIEVHTPYTVPECVADLEALGYDVELDPEPNTCIAFRRAN
jgi:FkbM family methyltransferase